MSGPIAVKYQELFTPAAIEFTALTRINNRRLFLIHSAEIGSTTAIIGIGWTKTLADW